MAATPPAHADDAAAAATTSDAGDQCSSHSHRGGGGGDALGLLQQRLEAHAADAAALVREVTRSADASEEQELELILRFLQSSGVDIRVVAQVALALIATVNSAFAVRDDTSDATLVTLVLLDQLVPAIIEQRARTSADSDWRRQAQATLVAYFRLATRRLSCEAIDEEERTILINWCELVCTASSTTSGGDETPNHHSFIISIASLLLALHDAVAERNADPTAANLKVVTLVWKNLTKMSSSFGGVLSASASESTVNSSETTDNTNTSNGSAFQVDDMLASVIASLEQCALQICDESLSEAKLTAALRFLRLYWRAFQGQLLSFISVLTSEVESSVMALVNVAASLTQLNQSTSVRNIPKKVQAEASRLLQMVVALAENLGGGDLGGIGALTREQVRVLLWHSDDEMVRAIQQRRYEEGPSPASHGDESSIRIGHLLVVAAFGSTDENILPADDLNEEIGGAKILAAATMLVERYQSCTLILPLKSLTESNALFLDSILTLLMRVADDQELELFLIKQLFHPDPCRRLILWDVWKEFMCYGWGEIRAGAMLMTLISLAQCEDEGPPSRGSSLAPGIQLEVYELIAFLYPAMPDSLKRICVDEATKIVDAIFSEGPAHTFTLKVVSQLTLLEKLSAMSFLKNYDHLEKEEWIAKYLPMCFECCGTVLDLLTSSSDLAHDEKQGMMRILDVALMVVKAILDDSDTDFDELARMLVPMSSEILTQLAKITPRATANRFGRSHKTPTILQLKLERETNRTLSRMLESSTHVLGKLGYLLKRNQTNQFVVALRDLSLILEQASAQEANGVAISIAWFAKTTLFDVQVAEGDKEVTWQLFTRLFRNLSSPLSRSADEAAAGEKRKSALPPYLSTTFDAFTQFLAHSNVVEYQDRHPSLSVSQMLHESAKAQFTKFLSLQQVSKAEVDKLCCAELNSSNRVQQARCQHRKLYCERFPDEHRLGDADYNDVESSKRSLESTDESEAAFNAPTDSQESETSQPARKRQKLDAFVSICKRTHQALSSSENSTSAAVLRTVTEQELDDATKVLEQLLAKAYCG